LFGVPVGQGVGVTAVAGVLAIETLGVLGALWALEVAGGLGTLWAL
jgi:hypothetical protein